MKKQSIFVLLLLSGVLIAGAGKKKDQKEESNVQIGKNLNSNRYDNLYFSGQPSSEDFQALKEQGFVAIINLRDPKEYEEAQEQKRVKDAGMKYINVPFSAGSKLNNEFLDKVTNNVKENRKDGKVLIHCSSGNRVALWLGGHFHKDHNYTKEQALELAKRLGLKKPGAVEHLETFLSGS